MRRQVLEQLLAQREQVHPWPCQDPVPAPAQRHPIPARMPLWARFESWEQVPPAADRLEGIILPISQWSLVPQEWRSKTILELPRAMFGAMEAAVEQQI